MHEQYFMHAQLGCPSQFVGIGSQRAPPPPATPPTFTTHTMPVGQGSLGHALALAEPPSGALGSVVHTFAHVVPSGVRVSQPSCLLWLQSEKPAGQPPLSIPIHAEADANRAQPSGAAQVLA